MQLLTEFDGSATNVITRTARAYIDGHTNNACVDFYADGVLIETRAFEGKTLRYAEDAAANFVSGTLIL